MSEDNDNDSNTGMDPVLIIAIVLAVVLILVIFVLIMCWKLRNRKHDSTNGGGNIVLTNPNPDVEGVNSDRVAMSKSKLISDPFMLNAGNLLKGEEKRKFDEIAQNLQDERFKFLVILNALRRDAKPLSADTEAFYTYRECIHELSRFLHLLNKSPEGIVPDDGLYLANWATQILAIYDNQRRIIAIPYSQLDMEIEEAAECFPIQQLRSSMRARRSSIGSSEGSSINDSAIRVDLESEDEEEEMRTSSQHHTTSYDDDVIVNPNSFNDDEVSLEDNNIIAAPVQFSKLNAEHY
ncbi:uncharacterized protein LOC134818192 isoform X1 [Bolinopsis microptera]|uniref:uncharacterized protein LOC134818192 isoform X1 n=2 Tax=Bolinopsis microptera TaxID=2820187 RepID=UPI00307B0B9C